MISQRLRGVKEDGEAIEEEGFMPKLKKAFGDVGISIEDQNGELRSTYDILNDLAGVWDQLSSKQRQYLGEKAAGNRQVKTLNAIMSNWDVVQDTIQKANEATGEATKGNEKYLDSIEGRITQFKSAFSDLARTTIDSDFVKGLIGGATNVTEFVTSIGGLVPVLSTITGSLIAIKGLKIAKGLEGIGTAIKGIVTNMAGANGLVGALTSIPGAIGLTIAALGAFTLVASAISNSKKSVDDYVEGSSKAKQNYEDQTSKVEGLNTELENTQKLISDLESKPSLTVLEEDQLSRLKDTNKELEDRIKLEKQLTRIAEIDMRKAAVDAVNAYKENTKTGESTFGIKNNIQPSDYLFRALGADRVESGASGEANAQGAIRPVFTQQDINELNKEALVALRDQISEEKKLLSEQGLYESERLNQLQDDYNSTLVALKEYYDFLDGQIGNTHRIENPVTTDEKNINALHNEKQALDDLFISVSELNKTEESNRIFEKYSQDIAAIKDIIKETGEITEGQLKEQFSGVFNEFIASGWEAEDVVRHINEELKSVSGETNLRDTKSIEELITNNYLASDSYKALSTAMTEQQKAGTISMETYQKLIESDEKLANALVLTADGYALNSDAVNEYIQTKTDEQRIQALLAYDEQNQKLEELKKRYEELSNATIKTDDVIKELAQNQDAQDAAERDKEAIAAYVRELDAATGALARFKAAQSSVNEDANFQDSKKVYEVLKEGNKTGKRNTDDFRTAADYVLGDNWRENLDQFGGSVEKAYQHAEKVAKRYSGQKDEKTAAKNFMKDVADAGFGTYDKKSGSLKLSEGVTLDDMAAKMGIAKGYLADMFKLLNTYANEGEGFTFPELFTDDEKKQAEERKKALEENEKAQEQMGNKVEDVNKQIESANERGDEKEAQRLEQQKKKYEDAQKVLEQEHTNIKNGVEMDVDTMTLEDAKKKIDELYETISTLNGAGIDIPVTIADSYNTLLETFPQLRGELQNPLPPINVKMTGDALPKLVLVDGKVKQLEGDHFVDVDVNDNGTADATKDKVEDIENDKYDAKVDATLGSDTATGDIKNIASGPYDPASIEAEADNASLSSVGKELDDLAKPRTVTYTPQIPEMPVPIDVPLDDSDGSPKEPSTRKTKTADEQRSEDEWNNWFDWFDGTYRNGGGTEQSVEVGVEASQESGEQIVEQVQKDINKEKVDFDPELQVDKWGLFGDNGEDKTVGVQTESVNPEEPIQQVQEAANATPVEMTFNAKDSLNAGSAMNSLIDKATEVGVDNSDGGKAAIAELRSAYVQLSKAREKAESVEIGDEAGAAQAASNLQSAANSFMTAYNNLSTMTSDLSVDPIEVDANTDAALKKVQAIADKGVTVKVDGNTSSLASAIDSYNNRTITVNIQTNEIGGNAKGTKNAAPGPSLVDEEGAELIEHVNRGTYELGTNNGPRLTNLEKGDVVHTASETNKILSRMAKVGGFFRNGLNQAKTIFGNTFATGVNGKVSGLNGSSSSKKKSSSKKSSKKKSSGGSKANMKKLQEWFEKLFDWAEIRLERLQTITDEWIYKAGQAIGYAAQNTQLANAMKSVENQIKDTTAAYNLYIAQADKVAKKTKLSADIINRIQNGTIEISSYDKNTQEKIKMYQTW